MKLHRSIRSVESLLLICALVPPCLAQGNVGSASEALATADRRIEKLRKADATVKVLDRRGRPVPGARVRAEQTRHRFLFGAQVFPLYQYKPQELFSAQQLITPPLVTGERKRIYEERFLELFNFATLGFQWHFYEPKPGEENAANVRRVIEWCRANGVTTKGHVLLWHQNTPKWASADVDLFSREALRHVAKLVTDYEGDVDVWDVVNETAEFIDAAERERRLKRFPNPMAWWLARDGALSVVGRALDAAHAADPNAVLLYNDYRLGPEFERLVGELVRAKKPVDAVGIQSHMHNGEWSPEKIWETCETYARFAKPLHFTEVSVLSGAKSTGGVEGGGDPKPWLSTPAGEQQQADYVEQFYTLLFSHPAVEAITWWDFKDGGVTWRLAPAGLLREDLTPKPAYERLRGLIKGKWWTRAEVTTDRGGAGVVRGFMGRYRVTVESPRGTRTQEFELRPGANVWTVNLPA